MADSKIAPNDDPVALRAALEQERAAAEKLADELNEVTWLLLQIEIWCLTDSIRVWLDMQLGETWRAILDKAKRRSPKSRRRTYKAPGS